MQSSKRTIRPIDYRPERVYCELRSDAPKRQPTIGRASDAVCPITDLACDQRPVQGNGLLHDWHPTRRRFGNAGVDAVYVDAEVFQASALRLGVRTLRLGIASLVVALGGPFFF